MKEVVIVSGKGGAGKTTVTASLAFLARDKVLADCDVDAADLHILVDPKTKHQEDFRGGVRAFIDSDKCSLCGECRSACRFDAITENFVVNPFACEGCGVCHHVCPEGAAMLEECLNGRWFISETRFGPMVHAALLPGEENSGKLVALVRNQARVLAKDRGFDMILCDGAPGIGCPVISSVTGASHALIVTEPTLSGLHDMKRVVELVNGFGIPISVAINKYDINADLARDVEQYCNSADIPVFGKIPYDESVVKAMVRRSTVMENGGGPVAEAISALWWELRRAMDL